MGKYKLIDDKLQKKITAIFPDFEEKLQEAVGSKFSTKENDVVPLSLGDETNCLCWLYFPNSQIVETTEYNPKKWNKWPDVDPLPVALEEMRVQFVLKNESVTRKACMVFTGKTWGCVPSRANIQGKSYIGIGDIEPGSFLFRPWSD